LRAATIVLPELGSETLTPAVDASSFMCWTRCCLPLTCAWVTCAWLQVLASAAEPATLQCTRRANKGQDTKVLKRQRKQVCSRPLDRTRSCYDAILRVLAPCLQASRSPSPEVEEEEEEERPRGTKAGAKKKSRKEEDVKQKSAPAAVAGGMPNGTGTPLNTQQPWPTDNVAYM
jgi:hypothetical protein